MIGRIRWQVLLIVGGVALVAVLLVYLAFTFTTTIVPSQGGTYIEGIAGSPQHLNPLLSQYNDVDRDICALLFSGLTRLDERGEVVPDLARDWQVSLDGLTYEFRLRANARWHDGEPVTARDVAFTISLIRDADYPGPPDLAELWRTVTVTVEADNPRLVRFTLSEPFAPFLDYTTVGILPAHLLQGIRAADLPTTEFNLSPVGTGPFQLEEIGVEEGAITYMTLSRNPYYYGQHPYLNRVRFQFYPNFQSVFSAYEAGEVEGVARVTLADLPRARAAPSLNIFSAQMAEFGMIFLNLGDPEFQLFQDKEVRQALMYGLDRQRLIDEVLDGQSLVAHSPIVAGTWAYDEDILRYDYDVESAQRLLDQAGWLARGGGTVRRQGDQVFAFTLLTSNEPEQVALAEGIARQWAVIGVHARVGAVSPLDLWAALENREYQALLTHLALPGDPDLYPFWHETQVEGGQNYAGLAHRRMSEVLEIARTTVDREQRLALYREFQTLFADEMPALILYAPVYTYAVDERIHGVQVGPIMQPSDRFRGIADWYVVTRRIIVSEAEAGSP